VGRKGYPNTSGGVLFETMEEGFMVRKPAKYIVQLVRN